MKSIKQHIENINRIQSELRLEYEKQASDLFTSEPTNLTDYMTERNKLIAADNPSSADDCNAANKHLADMKERFNNADPVRQLAMLGVKSGKAGKVFTEAEDKAKTKSRHAESNLQLKCLKWVKKWFPDDRTIVHKREGKRHGFNRAVLRTLNNNSDGYPDHEFSCAKNGLLYVEFKRESEGWLLKDNLTVKTAYRHQYKMHLQLWSEGKPVYFCNDFDKFRELYKAFKEGKPLAKQLYKLK